VASGTVGSFVTLVALWLIPFTTLALVVTLAVVTVVGIWAGSRVEMVIDAKDPGIIVIDEVAGMLVSVLFLPRTLPVLVTAFALFRLFDIWSRPPEPAARGELRIDDLIAGAYALVLLLVARRVWAFRHERCVAGGGCARGAWRRGRPARVVARGLRAASGWARARWWPRTKPRWSRHCGRRSRRRS
jgi:phosphatidylglycerophosphatase A